MEKVLKEKDARTMTVLLTGGAGFIGSHTAVELLKAGYDVTVVDDFSNSRHSVIDRIKEITGHNINIYELNVADKAALEQVFIKHSVDCVLHFAGSKAVGESVEQPIKYYRNNIDTTLSLLEVMKEYSVQRIVFSSSATVYGQPDRCPIFESAPVGNCSNPYGRTKYYNEQILTDWSKANPQTSVVLLRYFNPIGAHESGLIGERPQGIPNNLFPYITQTAAGIRDHLNVYGNDYDTPDGTGVRDYIHVVDLARAHVAALKYSLSHSGTEAFNIGTGQGYSVLEIVAAFEKENGVKIPYVIAPRRLGDIAACYADAGKAYEKLGWNAEKTLEDMMRDGWRWQKNINSLE